MCFFVVEKVRKNRCGISHSIGSGKVIDDYMYYHQWKRSFAGYSQIIYPGIVMYSHPFWCAAWCVVLCAGTNRISNTLSRSISDLFLWSASTSTRLPPSPSRTVGLRSTAHHGRIPATVG